jgi:transcriptional regulator with XRE-family HTH domain
MTHGPKKKLGTLDHLREYIVKNSTTPSRISKKLKISSSAIYGWLNGNLKPSVDSIAKIEGFLHDVGYYE